MKKLIVILAAGLFLLTSCYESPRATAESYMTAVQKGDWKTALDYTALEPEEKELIISLLGETTDQAIEKRNQIEQFEVVEEELGEDGRTANIRVKVTFGDGHEQEQTIPLEQDAHGRWLVKRIN